MRLSVSAWPARASVASRSRGAGRRHRHRRGRAARRARGARDDRPRQRIDAAARRRQDARARGRPTVGTIGGGCYENDAARQGAAGHGASGRAATRPATTSTTTSPTRPASSAAVRWTSSSSPSRRRPISTSSAPATSASTSRASRPPSGFRAPRRRRPRDVRQPRPLPRRRRGRRRRHRRSGWPSAALAPRLATSWSSHAAIDTTSTPCARSPRATSRYVGLIGSRAKVARIFDALRRGRRRAPTRSRRVHAPIGLDIGAVTPEEIAVSIVAELIAVRHGRRYRDGQRPTMRRVRCSGCRRRSPP